MKTIKHTKKISAQEINEMLQKQFPDYKQAEHWKINEDVLFMKTVTTFEELDTIPIKEIITGDEHKSGDTGLVMQDNADWPIGLPIGTVELLEKRGIKTIGDLRKADTEKGLRENGHYPVFEFLAVVERLLKN